VTDAELPRNFFPQAIRQPSAIKRLRLAVFGDYARDESGVFERSGARPLRYVPNLRGRVREVGV
jgi:hypothetical protein